MAARKKSGRATAEAKFDDLVQSQKNLIGDVGEAWENLIAVWPTVAKLLTAYEDAHAAAIKEGAASQAQLTQIGYPKPPGKLPDLGISEDPAPPTKPKARKSTPSAAPADADSASGHEGSDTAESAPNSTAEPSLAGASS